MGKAFLIWDTVTVTFCYITNHPIIYWLKKHMSLHVLPPSPAGWPRLVHRIEGIHPAREGRPQGTSTSQVSDSVVFATVPLAKGKSKFIPYSRSKDAIVIDGGGVMKSHRKGRWKFCSNICSWLPLLSLLCLELYSEWSHSQINMTIHSQSSILHSKSKRTMRIKVIRWLWLKEIILGY